jgi:hypothetical protein
MQHPMRCVWLASICAILRSRRSLGLENVVLRHHVVDDWLMS